MANIKSAKKRAKQNEYRHQVNLARKTAIKTAIKKVQDAIKNKKNAEEIKTLFRDAEGKLARAKTKGVLHENTVARKISNLAKKVAQVVK